jgi:tetratricopeptide (TPR) repeat protein
MTLSVSDQCRSCLATLQEVMSILSQPNHNDGFITHAQVSEELDRFSLFIGNIGALHRPDSSMSIESRLQEANDVLTHIVGLLTDLEEAAAELLEIVSGIREGMVSVDDEAGEEHSGDISELSELREEISGTITRLFRVSIIIRQAAPTDLFAKALSRNRYCFSDQFDIAHVGEKYRKLATKDCVWLRQRLGRAITQRRHYLSYIQDHHEQLGSMLNRHDKVDSSGFMSQTPVIEQPLALNPMFDMASRPSFFTKATTVAAEQVTSQLLVAKESDSEDDARSYTTISRSIDGDHESSITVRIPKLDDLRVGNKKEFECPFCFRIKKFKSERIWRMHVFSDLRPYVCTFPDCDAPYFGDINKWFQHEMTFHRVVYKCLLCPNKVYYKKGNYVSHLKRKHAEMLVDGGEQPGIELARKPLVHIPANDCPCCSDWVDRLKERTIQTSGSASNETILVTPTVFKRHLASHLEQLALFAVPIGVTTDNDNKSNNAMQERKSEHTSASQLSTLTFASFRGDLEEAIPDTRVKPSQSEVPHVNIQVTETETEGKNEAPGSPPMRSIELGDQDGADQSNTLNSMIAMASTYTDQGLWKEAEEVWKEAEELVMRVTEKSKTQHGQEHPDTLISMNNLATIYTYQERLKEAEELFVQTIELSEKILGAGHPSTLRIMINLARVLGDQEKYEEAEATSRKTLAQYEQAHGTDHPDTLRIMIELARILEDQEKYEEAEAIRTKTLALFEKVHGTDHPDTLNVMSDLAGMLEGQGKYEEAEAISNKMLPQFEKVLGHEHLDTLRCVYGLARLLANRGCYDESLALYDRAYAGYKITLGKEHSTTLACLQQRSEVLISQEQSRIFHPDQS